MLGQVLLIRGPIEPPPLSEVLDYLRFEPSRLGEEDGGVARHDEHEKEGEERDSEQYEDLEKGPAEDEPGEADAHMSM